MCVCMLEREEGFGCMCEREKTRFGVCKHERESKVLLGVYM